MTWSLSLTGWKDSDTTDDERDALIKTYMEFVLAVRRLGHKVSGSLLPPNGGSVDAASVTETPSGPSNFTETPTGDSVAP